LFGYSVGPEVSNEVCKVESGPRKRKKKEKRKRKSKPADVLANVPSDPW
jgi:hypothetical protein